MSYKKQSIFTFEKIYDRWYHFSPQIKAVATKEKYTVYRRVFDVAF